MKYVSDQYADNPYAPIILPEWASFKDTIALKGKLNIRDEMGKRIIGPTALPTASAEKIDSRVAGRCGLHG